MKHQLPKKLQPHYGTEFNMGTLPATINALIEYLGEEREGCCKKCVAWCAHFHQPSEGSFLARTKYAEPFDASKDIYAFDPILSGKPPKPQPTETSWEESFKKDWEGKGISPLMIHAVIDNIYCLLSSERAKVRELIPDKKQECDCESEDSLGYHTKDCSFYPMGWNECRKEMLRRLGT